MKERKEKKKNERKRKTSKLFDRFIYFSLAKSKFVQLLLLEKS